MWELFPLETIGALGCGNIFTERFQICLTREGWISSTILSLCLSERRTMHSEPLYLVLGFQVFGFSWVTLSSCDQSQIPSFPAVPWEPAHIFFTICFTDEMASCDSELYADSLDLTSHSVEACVWDLTSDSESKSLAAQSLRSFLICLSFPLHIILFAYNTSLVVTFFLYIWPLETLLMSRWVMCSSYNSLYCYFFSEFL